MKHSAITLSIITVLLLSCTKEPLSPLSNTNPATNNSPKPPTDLPVSKSILVDASKDGGGWWFPQSSATGFTTFNQH